MRRTSADEALRQSLLVSIAVAVGSGFAIGLALSRGPEAAVIIAGQCMWLAVGQWLIVTGVLLARGVLLPSGWAGYSPASKICLGIGLQLQYVLLLAAPKEALASKGVWATAAYILSALLFLASGFLALHKRRRLQRGARRA